MPPPGPPAPWTTRAAGLPGRYTGGRYRTRGYTGVHAVHESGGLGRGEYEPGPGRGGRGLGLISRYIRYLRARYIYYSTAGGRDGGPDHRGPAVRHEVPDTVQSGGRGPVTHDQGHGGHEVDLEADGPRGDPPIQDGPDRHDPEDKGIGRGIGQQIPGGQGLTEPVDGDRAAGE